MHLLDRVYPKGWQAPLIESGRCPVIRVRHGTHSCPHCSPQTHCSPLPAAKSMPLTTGVDTIGIIPFVCQCKGVLAAVCTSSLNWQLRWSAAYVPVCLWSTRKLFDLECIAILNKDVHDVLGISGELVDMGAAALLLRCPKSLTLDGNYVPHHVDKSVPDDVLAG